MATFGGTDFMLEASGAVGPLRPSDGDFTIAAVYRSAATARGIIWWKDDGAGKRWLLRIATGGTDMEWSVDDNTTAQTLTADDVNFANDTMYVIFAIRRGDTLEFFYGTGGALSEATNSPFSLPASYGDLGLGQAILGASDISGNQNLAGEIGEIFFYKEALDSDQRDELNDFLIGKWEL
jgi:hypothetical protein